MSCFGGRLHLIICVRDVVYSATRESEHSTRYAETEYIHTLDWSRDAIRYFLAKKLERLPDRYFAEKGDGGRSVAAWLGTRTLHNKRAPRSDEDIERYLLRHTRLIPRDIVVTGNMLCRAIASTRTGRLTDTEIREVVKSAARIFGDEQLAICANQIASDLMPADAIELGYGDIYTGENAERFEGGHAYQQGLVDDLREKIGAVRKDRFGQARFRGLCDDFNRLFRGKADPINALWQNGLLGYTNGKVETGEPVFYAATREDSLKIPMSKRGYAFHPILIDSIEQLRGVGRPVDPC